MGGKDQKNRPDAEQDDDTFEVITPKGNKVKFHSIVNDLKSIGKELLQDEESEEKKGEESNE